MTFGQRAHDLPVYVARRIVPARFRPRLFQVFEDTSLFRALHGEANVIETELQRSREGAWTGLADAKRTAAMTERVVEVPWVISRINNCERLLDIGSSFAPRVYIRSLLSLGIPELCGVDLSNVPVAGMEMTNADVRSMPFPEGHFDVITCISTIEHIGFDNAHYAAGVEASTDQDSIALAEMERVLRPGGRLLITVPFGMFGIHSWFKQYDQPAWRALVGATGLVEQEVSLFELHGDGWQPCGDGEFPTGAYRGRGAPGATGVLCAWLTKPAGPVG